MCQVRRHSIRHQRFGGAAELFNVGTADAFGFAFQCRQHDAAAGFGGKQSDDGVTGGRGGDVEVFGVDGSTRSRITMERRKTNGDTAVFETALGFKMTQ